MNTFCDGCGRDLGDHATPGVFNNLCLIQMRVDGQRYNACGECFRQYHNLPPVDLSGYRGPSLAECFPLYTTKKDEDGKIIDCGINKQSMQLSFWTKNE